MIPAQYYHTVYLVILLVLAIVTHHKYFVANSRTREDAVPSFLLMTFMAIFIGLRPISFIFVDMGGYAAQWSWWNKGTFEFSWDWANVIFDNMRVYMATTGIPVTTFFFLISIIYFGCMFVACRKLFPNDTFAACLVALSAFSTFSYGTNGIKAGAAASIFLIALAFNRKLWMAILFSLISLGFHHSMSMVLGSFVIVKFIKKPKFYFILWIFSLFVAAAHISVFQSLFASMADEGGAVYLQEQTFGKGFRIDFILYSAMPVLVGYIAIFKKKIDSPMYNTILNMYLMTNSIWMLCMYAEFTNRIAYLSWFMYPIVLIYPLLNERWGEQKYQTFATVASLHLAFTLFMSFIYY